MAFIGNSSTTQQFTPQIDYFSGNASTIAFTLSRTPGSVASVIVAIENVIQNPSSAFTISGNTITFTSAPPTGTNNIWVEYTSLITQTIAPGQGTVIASSFASNTIIPVSNGGTGLSSVGTSGNVLTSNGTAWISQVASGFASGTLMLFQQTAAPTGWTKQVTHDNKALRVVSGTAGSGGTTGFTTVFANQTPTINVSGLSAGATTLSTTQIPSHAHGFIVNTGGGGSPAAGYAFAGGNTGSASTNNAGGGGSHSHSISGSATSSVITLDVQYVDLIIASKD